MILRISERAVCAQCRATGQQLATAYAPRRLLSTSRRCHDEYRPGPSTVPLSPYDSKKTAPSRAASDPQKPWQGKYQDLASFDPILDIDTLGSVVLSADAKARGVNPRDPLAAVHRNRKPVFRASPPPEAAMHQKGEQDPLVHLHHLFPGLTYSDFETFHRYMLHMRRFVVYRKSVGKVNIVEVVCCVGNGDGMLGLGIGYHTESLKAREEAQMRAIKNMVIVNRCEGRTIWNRREDKLSATVIQMWPRPPGFGISTRSAVMNRMCKAAGIKDITLRIRRSRNRYFVAQLLWRMLKADAHPIGFGNGLGKKGNRLEKGFGMLSNAQVANALGRRIHWHL